MGCGDGIGFVVATERNCPCSCQRCGQRVIRAAHDVVLGLRLGQAISSSAKEAPQVHIRILLDAVFFLEIPSPELAACPEFGNLFPDVAEYVEVEGEAADKSIHVVASSEHIVYVSICDQYGISDLLRRRCT